tara:strand:- start:780 stop:1142 length:363 start_codon:yes stop_codon:yes gene_type:complete
MDRLVERDLTKQQGLYLDKYLLKSGDDIIDFMTGGPNSRTVDVPGMGWFEYEVVEDDVFWIWSAYSHQPHKYTKLIWNRMLKLAKEKNCDKIRFTTTRNPKAFERLFKVKTIAWKLELEL